MREFIIDDKIFHFEDLSHATQFKVHSSPRSYEVFWDDSSNPTQKINQKLAENPNNLCLIDQKVYENYGKDIDHPREQIYVIEATEFSKSLEGVMHLLDFLQQRSLTKGETLVVVGGGITQDLCGFVASIYKRGVPWILFPTTFLSMCDSCIGAKTGVNYKGAKNQLAIFSSPHQIIINPSFLNTLSPAEIQSGLGETLKVSLMGGIDALAHFQSDLANAPHYDYKSLILHALSIKKAVIEVDEFEFNYRKCMNYGHTLGHAIESLSHYKIPHGLAVVMGIILANELSCARGLLSPQLNTRIRSIAERLLNPSLLEYLSHINLSDLVPFIKQDKKTRGNTVSFVMLTDLGHLKFVPIELEEFASCFSH